ncbi:metalloprotease [Coemansia biformis]|uniref:UDP-N-acetylglucosamine transferase subunit ALG14 n=1 Tax=Coemansia biformis TaxID=1286918 RepID=A0A9W7Y6Z7_9FUNG|nr:metalloprotease [Coemansia biformis]
MQPGLLVGGAALLLLLLLVARLYFVLPGFGRPARAAAARRKKGKAVARGAPNKLLCIVLGSGGHTTEMMRLLQGVDFERYTRRLYIVGRGDGLSLSQLAALESTQGRRSEGHCVEQIPRSRSVGQSWLTAPVSVARCLARVVALLYEYSPDVILCNGPGNCVVVCAVALVPRILGLKHIPIIYVESFARVNTMSLSGKLVYPMADRFVVQWPGLARKYPRAECFTHLV